MRHRATSAASTMTAASNASTSSLAHPVLITISVTAEGWRTGWKNRSRCAIVPRRIGRLSVVSSASAIRYVGSSVARRRDTTPTLGLPGARRRPLFSVPAIADAIVGSIDQDTRVRHVQATPAQQNLDTNALVVSAEERVGHVSVAEGS